ncbi:MAG: hypothetical protein U9Q74_06700 [Gemmatimonadota bacterium]|nr:hypothetical protein [Gemmatimonadota bacterium]
MPRRVDVAPDNLFEIRGDSREGQKVVGDIRRKVDQEVHVAVAPSFRPHDGAENRDVYDAAHAKLGLAGSKFREDGREGGHAPKPMPVDAALQRERFG